MPRRSWSTISSSWWWPATRPRRDRAPRPRGRTSHLPVLGASSPGRSSCRRRHAHAGKVAVIGTPGTIASVRTSGPSPRSGAELLVKSHACPLFVPLARRGSGPPVKCPAWWPSATLGQGLLDGGVDTLVLGCTHYRCSPAVIASVAGPEVRLVDSAQATRRAGRRRCSPRRAFSRPPRPVERPVPGDRHADPLPRVGRRFLGHPLSGAVSGPGRQRELNVTPRRGALEPSRPGLTGF